VWPGELTEEQTAISALRQRVGNGLSRESHQKTKASKNRFSLSPSTPQGAGQLCPNRVA